VAVTNTGSDSRLPAESHNTLADIEAEMDAMLEGRGLDTSDEARAQRRRRWDALKTARMCGECGEPLGEDATVYRLRYPEQGLVGMGYRTRVECDECVRKPKEPFFSLRACLRVHSMVQSGMDVQEAWAKENHRDPVYDYCDACGRKVVFDRTGIRRKRTFCSERCERDSYNRRRREARAATRGKACDACGETFVGTRSDAKHCSAACKQRAYRNRNKATGYSRSRIFMHHHKM
jgi:hypothetical protein